MLELIYTSAKSGLKPASSGFTSVAWTAGIPTNCINPLEDLSGYRPVWKPGDPRSENNPVVHAFQHIRYGNLEFFVCSRIAYAGLDYSGRSNKIAHHILLENLSELPASPYGPAGVFLSGNNFRTEWTGKAELLPPRSLKQDPLPAMIAGEAPVWAKWKGNPLWAKIAAYQTEKILRGHHENEALYLEYTPEIPPEDVLRMAAEVLQFLPADLRKICTFNTYFIQPGIGVDAVLRFALPDTPALQTMKRLKKQNVISLIRQEELPPMPEEFFRREEPEANENARPAEAEDADDETINLMDIPPSGSPEQEAAEKAPRAEKTVQKEHDRKCARLLLTVLLAGLLISGGVCAFLFFSVSQAPEPPEPVVPVLQAGKKKAKTLPPVRVLSERSAPAGKKPPRGNPGHSPGKHTQAGTSSPKKGKTHAEERLPLEKAKKIFLDFNQKLIAMDPEYQMQNLPLAGKILRISIRTADGKLQESGNTLNYGTVFRLTVQGKSIFMQRLEAGGMREEDWDQMCCIREIRVRTAEKTLIIPFGIEPFLPKKPEVTLSRDSFRLSIKWSKLEREWMKYYCTRTEPASNRYESLLSAARTWNRTLKAKKTAEKRYAEIRKSAQKTNRKELGDFQKKKTEDVNIGELKQVLQRTANTVPRDHVTQESELREVLMQYDALLKKFRFQLADSRFPSAEGLQKECRSFRYELAQWENACRTCTEKIQENKVEIRNERQKLTELEKDLLEKELLQEKTIFPDRLLKILQTKAESLCRYQAKEKE